MQDPILRLSALFEGFTGAYGTYDQGRTEKNAAKGGKIEIKSSARTVRAKVTRELWIAHVDGRAPLGIIPIREDETCLWGCVDVDRYDSGSAEILKNVEKYRFPLIGCRTKSGGLHLFLFVKEAVAASRMQAKLREMAASLGLGDCEIFPKQTAILADRGDLGNWLNMPYFGGARTSQYGLRDGIRGMLLSEFLDAAEKIMVSNSEFDKIAAPESKDETLEDGPPCLQHLATVGFPEGTRNNGLFALGVFCKKKFGSDWQEVLERYNQNFLSPPLGSDEVAALIKNLEKKTYQYKCSDQPCVSHCNSALCRTRKYGVGGSEQFPILTGMSFLDTDPPLWFADVDGQRIELTTDQLQNFKHFHKVAMERLHTCYMMLKQDTWLRMINGAMRDAIRIEASHDVSVNGQFMELLEDFCVSRHRAEKRDDIASGKPWEDEEARRFYFRLRDLHEFLDRARFVIWGRNKIASELERIGGRSFFNVRGKGTNVYWIKNDFVRIGRIELPPSQKDPI